MNPAKHVLGEGFPCQDVNHLGYRVPTIEVDPQAVSIVMIAQDIAAALNYVRA